MKREFLIKVDVPDWATCYAIDESGDIYYYENKPVADDYEEMWISKGRVEFSGIALGSNLFGDWRQTLHEIIKVD
jgi:hypothetical protein